MKGGKLQQVVRAEELQRVGARQSAAALTRTLEPEQLGGSREENSEAKGVCPHPPTLAEMSADSMILTEPWFSHL